MKQSLPFNLEDIYESSKSRIVFTKNELNIPGLKMFGKHTMTNAVAPLPSHFHENCFEITLVTNGTLSFKVANEEYDISGYSVFITYPNEVHSTNLHALSAGEIYWFQLDITYLNNIFHLNPNASKYLINSLLDLKTHIINSKHSDFSNYIKLAFQSVSTSSPNYLSANYLSLALMQLINLAPQLEEKLPEDISIAIQYINANIYSPLLIEELADVANLSVSQFKQKFRKYIGSAPRHYINHLKVNKSKKLLKKGVSITKVAMDLGFNTSSYFSVVFKRYNACSPREYLNKLKVN